MSQRPDLKFVDPFKDFQLSSNNVTSVEQDTLGYIWIGTLSGLNRFDGYNMKIYKFTAGDTNSLVYNEITRLFRDRYGRLWVGTRRGLCLYIPEHDYFRWLAYSENTSGLNSLYITGINEDNEGNLYISTASELFMFKDDSKDFIPVFKTETGEISSFLFDRDNNIWIAASRGGGLIKVDTRKNKTEYFLHDDNDPFSISGNSPVSLAIKGDKLWIATYDSGINCLDFTCKSFKKYPVNNEYELMTRNIYVDKNGLVWATDLVGLKIFDEEHDIFAGYYPMEKNTYSIKPSCVGIFQDSQGNYWTLHNREGVGLSVVPKGFQFFDNSPENYWYISSENVSCANDDENGNLWIGNPSNGIDVFNWSKGIITRYRNNPADKYSIGPGATFSLFRDSGNTMWIGTNSGGLQYFDKSSGRFISYINVAGDTNSIANNDVRSIAEDKQGNLWVVVHGKGVDRFEKGKRIFSHFNNEHNNLSNDYAFQVMVDRNGNLWVATVWGLSVLKDGETRFKNYFMEAGDTASLSDNEIISLYEDDNGRIWIGTMDGLNRYNPETDSFERFNRGVAGSTINMILSDRRGQIWLGTTKGISVLDPATGECKDFDSRDGILSSEIYPRAGYKNSINTLFFGGDRGINLVKPDELKFNEIPPRVLITNLKLFNREINEDSEERILNKEITYTESIRLKKKYNVITFEFLALNMINTARNRYAYKLEGFDKEWINAGERREVTYTNLDHKKYIFRVIASNNDGYWNYEGDSLKVTIVPPWYETSLFRILMVVFLVLLFVAFYSFRVSLLNKQKLLLESQVKERTSELSEKNELLKKKSDDLNETNLLLEERQKYIESQSEELRVQAENLLRSNNELKQSNNTKNKLFSIIAHDLKNPFGALKGFSEILARDYYNIGDEEKRNLINLINISSDRIHYLLENLLRWSRSQTGNIKVNRRTLKVNDIVLSNTSVMEHLMSQKLITCKSFVPEDLEFVADEDMVSTIIRNLLNNAIKFTPHGGMITISAEQAENRISVLITDTGMGISPERLNSIFDSVGNDNQSGTDGEKGSGLGLMICKEFAEINGGKMSVISELGKGSTFILTLPV